MQNTRGFHAVWSVNPGEADIRFQGLLNSTSLGHYNKGIITRD